MNAYFARLNKLLFRLTIVLGVYFALLVTPVIIEGVNLLTK
jgi:hypothetical protein